MIEFADCEGRAVTDRQRLNDLQRWRFVAAAKAVGRLMKNVGTFL